MSPSLRPEPWASPSGSTRSCDLSEMRHTMLRTAFLVALASCGTTQLDAGSDRPHGQLPVDERNPMLLTNDGARDNWQGEYAVTWASSGQLVLVGIIVNTSPEYPSIDTNMQ